MTGNPQAHCPSVARSLWSINQSLPVVLEGQSLHCRARNPIDDAVLFVPWEIECRIEARGLIAVAQSVTCMAARGDPPHEDLAGPASYPQWLVDSDPAWALHQFEEMLDEDRDDARFRAEARDILAQVRVGQPARRAIANRLQQLPGNAWDAGSLYEDAGPTGH